MANMTLYLSVLLADEYSAVLSLVSDSSTNTNLLQSRSTDLPRHTNLSTAYRSGAHFLAKIPRPLYRPPDHRRR